MNASAQCGKHKVLPCPPSCWVIGRTLLSIFKGKLVGARTFNTAEDAEMWAAWERDRMAQHVEEYEAKKLPVPDQLLPGRWVWVAWDGNNAPRFDAWDGAVRQ